MNKSSKDFRIGVTFALINSFSLGILGLIDKIGASQSGINPFIFSTQSVLFGLIFTTIFALLYQGKGFIAEFKTMKPHAWQLMLLIGICAGGIFNLLRFLGLAQSTGTFATLSQIITTALTAIAAYIFLKEKLPGRFWILFITIIIATYFASVGKMTFAGLQLGDLFIILGTVFLAASNIFSKLAVKHVSPVMLAFGRFFFGGILLLLISLIFFEERTDLLTITLWSIISGLFWTINSTAFNFAIQKIGITLVTSLLMLAPILTMILEYIFLKQSFTLIQIIAAFVVIICGILIVRSQKK